MNLRESIRARRARTRIASALLAGALVTGMVAACASGTGGDATGEVQTGGTLRLAAPPSGTEALDPFLSTGGVSDVQPNLFYERLYDFDSDGVPQPFLAENATTEDGLTWTIELKQGIMFHDGAELTSADAVYSFQRMLDPDLGTEAAGYFPGLTAENVEAVDEYTFTLTFPEVFADLPPVLAQKTVRIVRDGLTDYSHPVGTGPFVLDEWVPTQSLTAQRFEDYWREGKPALDTVRIDVLDEDAALAALRAGQIDAVERLDPAKVPEVEAGGLELFESPTSNFTALVMRTETPPFDDPRVREAFRLIVDRQQFLDNVRRGYGRIGNDLTSIDDPAYASDLPQREQDLERAKQLLAEAGQSDLTTEIVVYSPYENYGAVFARQAKDAGVTVNVRTVPSDVFWATEFMVAPFSTVEWFGRPLAQMMPLTTGPDAPYNDQQWDRPEFNAQLAEALSTLEEGERTAIFHDLQEQLYDEGGYIIPVFDNALAAHVPELQGLEPSPYMLFGGYKFGDLWMESQ